MKTDMLLLTLQNDMLANILAYASDIGRCSERITVQIREIIGARIVALFELNPQGEHRLLAACPERRAAFFTTDEGRRLIASAGHFTQAAPIHPGEGEMGRILAGLGMKESYVVPLRVGEESFGLLVLLDLMDDRGAARILEILHDISGVLSLVFKNSYLYRNMESLVEERTKALTESEMRSRMILQTAMDGFWRLDAAGRLLEVNEAYCRMSGYGHHELIGMRIDQLETNQTPEEVEAALKRVQQGEYLSFETVHRRKDGSLLDLEVSTQMRHGSDGSEIIAFLRDITERKRAEEETRRLQAQLMQAQKMEAIGTLAGGIAHDFNNILGAILGYAEMVQDACPAHSTVAHDIEQVLKAGNRAKELVKQILAFSRQAKADQVPLQPALIIKEAVKMLRSSLPATITIRQDLSPDAGFILADPTQIHQIMMNLCTNALHAMELEGGILTVSLRKKELGRDDVVDMPHMKPGKYLQLSIQDTGIGISPEIRERIFDPYFTTKEVGKGTGMGLSIVHGIAQSLGGSIVCDSRPGAGTVFNLFLPAVEGHALQEGGAAENIPTGHEHILLVDDEEILVEMGKTLLERLGYRVTARKNSIEALTTFQNQPEAFDLIITDQTMPGMTGIDLSRRILQIRPEIPILLCTGYSSLISEEKALALGIRGFIMKPLTNKDIAVSIRKLLNRGSSPA